MNGYVSLSNKDAVITTWAIVYRLGSFRLEKCHQLCECIRFVLLKNGWVIIPIPKATAVQGALNAGDGMEYPMITVISGQFPGNNGLETIVCA
jgi:hypothetical protein